MHGIDFVTHLRGMFAFALFDKKANQLILGRDRMGEKPLYLAESTSGFSFSSEIRTLIQSRISPLDLDPSNLPSYFLYGFVPEPLTLVKGIRKVPAGTLEVLSLTNGEQKTYEYWKMFPTELNQSLDPAQELRDLLDEVGEITARSDVPVGIALSGGLDSSIVASLVNSHTKNLKALSVGYSGFHSSDESADAIKFAKFLGITPYVVKLNPYEVATRFKLLCFLSDEPIADIAGPSYLALAELAQFHGIKVLFTGQGADELFWGYPWARKVAHSNSRRAKTLFGDFKAKDYIQFDSFPTSKEGLRAWIKFFLGGGGLKENLLQMKEDFYERKARDNRILVYNRRPQARKIKKISRKLLTSPAFFDPIDEQIPIDKEGSSDQIIRVLAQTYLRSNGLAQIDRLCMSASVESRTPFVDHKIVEFAIRESSKSNSFKFKPKSLLTEAVKDLIPPEILNRKKRGFTPPTKLWYQSIYSSNKEYFANPRIVELGLVNESAKVILNKPLNLFKRPRLLWLELAVLELWVRSLKETQPD
jgi:asparagine synthase (glutamine-hydrolysing)